jgi:glucose dehydrogenase
VVNGQVYVGAANGLYSIEAATGKITWVLIGGPFDSSPTVENGVIYVGGSDGFYAVDANTGVVIWKTNTFPTTGLAFEFVAYGAERGHLRRWHYWFLFSRRCDRPDPVGGRWRCRASSLTLHRS